EWGVSPGETLSSRPAFPSGPPQLGRTPTASRTCSAIDISERRAQLAQQKNRPLTSTPCPKIRHPQCSHCGASRCAAHSRESNVCTLPPTVCTSKVIQYSLPHTSQVPMAPPPQNSGRYTGSMRPPPPSGNWVWRTEPTQGTSAATRPSRIPPRHQRPGENPAAATETEPRRTGGHRDCDPRPARPLERLG